MKLSRTPRIATLLAGLFLAFSMVAVDHADARRGGSFGSRGTRTFQSVPPTRTAPQQTAPIERSMTPNTGQAANPATNAANPGAATQQQPGFFGGFGRSLLGGLVLGGLIGLLFGHGFGGLAGMFGLLLQVLLIGGGLGAAPLQPATREIKLDQSDLDTFQQMLTEVQEAFGREDHKALRRLVTPEMVSYLSEELADNAQNGVRNDVTDVRLLQADIAEAWNEDGHDYATAALNYSSVDVTRDRTTGEVVDGESEEPTETTELWTFVRPKGGDWKLSAIQEA
jgi:predicted lipid-binding transport protein (Tim44 family)